MFRHILVPLDGSGLAEAALPAAALLAEEFHGRVTLFHVVERNAPRKIHGQPHISNDVEAEAYLEGVARRAFPEGMKVEWHVHAAKADNVAESIVEHAAELNHDAIVMCSHGLGGALHLILGSIAEKVISKGELPVLVVRPDRHGGVPEFSCKRLLLPLDGDPDHEQSLPVSKELAKKCGSVLHLAIVVPGFRNLSGERAVSSRFLPGTTSKMLEISVRHADEYLQRLRLDLQALGFEASAHVLRGDPAAVINDFVGRFGIGLIVMATHGKSGIDAFWAGSVAHRVSSRNRTPLLLIPVTGG